MDINTTRKPYYMWREDAEKLAVSDKPKGLLFLIIIKPSCTVSTEYLRTIGGIHKDRGINLGSYSES